MRVEDWLSTERERVERRLEALLPREEGPARRLAAAMRYAVLGGGKRLRPILAIAACESCGGSAADVLDAAAALEILHTYSLVHDDLPAMDDDDLRRGRPTTHRVHGEAAAILAGDALLTLAFEILATHPPGHSAAARRADAVAVVAAAAGAAGMVGGQLADLEAEGRPSTILDLEWIHRHKTAALLSAAAELGAIHANAAPETRRGLARFGEALGLAFQVADDILDRTASAEALGKTPGKDAAAGKTTYPGVVGLEAARAEAERWRARAVAALPREIVAAERLEALAAYAVERTR